MIYPNAIEVRQNQVRVMLGISRKVYIVEGETDLYVYNNAGQTHTTHNMQGSTNHIKLVKLQEVKPELVQSFKLKYPESAKIGMAALFEPPLKLMYNQEAKINWYLEDNQWISFDTSEASAT